MNKFFVILLFPLIAFSALASPAHVERTRQSQIEKDPARDAFVQQVLALVNKERSRYKLKLLVLDKDLTEVAQLHAQDMARRDYFSHKNPEGKSGGDRITNAGIPWHTWGENIANSYKTPEEVMQGWMNSKGHRANILGADFGRIGIGFYEYYWVQNFTD
jgi:uncharacterized protein YkwD